MYNVVVSPMILSLVFMVIQVRKHAHIYTTITQKTKVKKTIKDFLKFGNMGRKQHISGIEAFGDSICYMLSG